MSIPLTRKQVEDHALTCWNKASEQALLAHDAALRQELATAQVRLTELEKDQHAPTVTYWMNMAIQYQQEAKKRFDDWFVVQQRVEELQRQLSEVSQLATANNLRHP